MPSSNQPLSKTEFVSSILTNLQQRLDAIIQINPANPPRDPSGNSIVNTFDMVAPSQRYYPPNTGQFTGTVSSTTTRDVVYLMAAYDAAAIRRIWCGVLKDENGVQSTMYEVYGYAKLNNASAIGGAPIIDQPVATQVMNATNWRNYIDWVIQTAINTGAQHTIDRRVCHSSCHDNCHGSRGRR